MFDQRRDFIGYGSNPPDPRWPNNAKIAVQFVLNYEEGGENNPLDGDKYSETFLSDIVPVMPFANRHMSMESMYEYGSRAGLWRVLRIFQQQNIPLTIFGVAKALERNPLAVKAFNDLGHEIASHGLKWISYQEVDEQTEKADMLEATNIITKLLGQAPKGWYTGRDSPQTRKLLLEQGGYLYDSDSYADDLPYWVPTNNQQNPWHLVIPYTLETNDMRFSSPAGFADGNEFFTYIKDAFDFLYMEGKAGSPKMLSIGLHCRIIGRPARAHALQKFLDYIQTFNDVWIPRRIDIAEHWYANHYPNGLT